jgi:hypothetical protein
LEFGRTAAPQICRAAVAIFRADISSFADLMLKPKVE